jgi:uncharacterized protein (DUF779 family)
MMLDHYQQTKNPLVSCSPKPMASSSPTGRRSHKKGGAVGREGALAPTESARRVTATPAAVDLLAALTEKHGPLLLHQSGGCCDGSSTMCYSRGDFLIGDADVFLGLIGEERATTPVYIGGAQFEYWSHTRLMIDVVAGRGAGFSLEAPEGLRFLTRSRLFTDDEARQLEAAGPVPRGEWRSD